MNTNSLKNLKENDTKGVLSKKAKSKIALRINWLHTIAKNKRTFNPKYGSNYWWKVNMVTLTLPSTQNSNDTLLKRKLLNTFFVTARRKWKLVHYVWRAELQNNGNIHFHILTDVFLPWQEVRDSWNGICKENGYKIETKNGGVANSVDIHSLRKVKNVIAYAIKYLAQNEKSNRKLEGKLWSCSKSLAVLNAVDIPIDYDLNERLQEMRDKKELKCYHYEWVTLIEHSMIDFANRLDFIGEKIKEYIRNQWDFLRSENKTLTTKISQTWKQLPSYCNGSMKTGRQLELSLDF